MNWLVTQIGSREHYAVPRAFHAQGKLHHFYTDIWSGRFHGLARHLPGPLQALNHRFHPDLPRDKVTSFNFANLRHMARGRLHRGTQSIEQDFDSFARIGQEFALCVNRHLAKHPFDPAGATAFLFSTGALETCQRMRQMGVPVVVDQLDPARLDEQMVQAEMQAWPDWEPFPGKIPESYYARLAEEWRSADLVLVNSNWSRKNLLAEGIDDRKIVVVPLCYEPRSAPPLSRSKDKPLTVLWLGQIILRKGIPYYFEAARQLASTHIRFITAGRIGISQTGLNAAPPNMQVLGRVSRQRAVELFREADVFVLPTISDGFALTQLEAMSFGLPVIATPNCGEVVTDGEDGFIVPPRDSQALASAILRLDQDRDLLRQMSARATLKSKEERFTLAGYVQAVENALESCISSKA